MPPGPPPKPIEQRLREGNRARRPLPTPVLIAGRPGDHELDTPPAHLPRDGQQLWAHVVPSLTECGLLDRVDAPLLEAMCLQWARVCQAGRMTRKHGMWTKGSVGQLKEAPWVKLEREAIVVFERLASAVGIGPVGRTRLGIAEMTRRSLAAELESQLGPLVLEVVDGTAEDDAS